MRPGLWVWDSEKIWEGDIKSQGGMWREGGRGEGLYVFTHFPDRNSFTHRGRKGVRGLIASK